MTRTSIFREATLRARSVFRGSPIGWRIGLVIVGYLAYTAAITVLDGRPPAPEAVVALDASDGSPRAGSRIWDRHGCATCHSLAGLGGHVGPDLTNYGRPEWRQVVRTTVTSGRLAMPSFDLTDRELDDLAAFLASVSRRVAYPPRTAWDSVFGDGDR